MGEIFKVLDAYQIDYVKWDMDRSVSNVFSSALSKERQGEVYHRYVLAVYDLDLMKMSEEEKKTAQ